MPSPRRSADEFDLRRAGRLRRSIRSVLQARERRRGRGRGAGERVVDILRENRRRQR